MTNGHNSNQSFMKQVDFKILGICLLLLPACGGEPEEAETPTEAEKTEQTGTVFRYSDLKLLELKKTDAQQFEPISGRVIPQNQTELISEVQGRAIAGSHPFKAGTLFRKGETLIGINSAEFALNLDAQRSSFLNILTGIMPDLKADYTDAYPNWQAYVQNYKMSQTLPDLPKPKSDSEKYFLTSNQVYSSYYAIKAQEERLSKFSIRAPYDGMLSVANLDQGGLVNPGQSIGTFMSFNNYEIESAASRNAANTIEIGAKVTFRFPESDKSFEAIVVRINKIVDQGTQNIPIYFTVKGEGLQAGIYLEGKIPVGNMEGVISIPTASLNRDNTVYVLADDVITKVDVRVLGTQGDSLFVTGLAVGQKLILNSFNVPVNGLKIMKDNG